MLVWPENRSRYVAIAILFLSTYIVFILLDSMPSIFTERDFWRAMQFSQRGTLPAGGSELSSGGTTLGPGLYAILSLPLFLYPTYGAMLFFLGFFHASAIIGATASVARNYGFSNALLLGSSLALSPLINTNLRQVWNPSFVPGLLALSFALFLEIHRNRKSVFLLEMMLGLLMGIAVQVHYSALFPVFGIYLSMLFGRGKTIKGISFGIACSLLPFWLYFQSPLNSTGLNPGNIREGIKFSWALLVEPEAFGAHYFFRALLLLAPLSFYIFLFDRKRCSLRGFAFKPMFWPTLLSLPAAAIFIVNRDYDRYAIAFCVSASFLFFCREIGESNEPKDRLMFQPKLKVALWMALALACIYSETSLKEIWAKNYQLTYSENQQIQKLAAEMNLNLGENSRYQIFLIGINFSTFTPSLALPSQNFDLQKMGSGLIVAGPGIENPLSLLPAGVKEEIAENKILITPLSQPGHLKIFSYKVAYGTTYPRGFANSGEGYPGVHQGELSTTLKENSASEVCRGRGLPPCPIKISLGRKDGRLELLISGRNLATSQFFLSDSGILMKGVSLVARCERNIFSLPIAESLGPKAPRNLISINLGRLTAPLARDIPDPCKNKTATFSLFAEAMQFLSYRGVTATITSVEIPLKIISL